MLKVFSLMKNNFYLPTPLNITNMWSFGVLLGVMMVIQFVSGVFLSMYYTNNVGYSFFSYIMMSRNINGGFILKFMHANGASLIFFLMYIHIYRSLLNKSALSLNLWLSGIILFVLSMMTAFLGYVLPWGQMSFWAATVITNLISSIPYLGEMLTKWVWGGFSVSNPTLNRFFSFHYLIPMFILFMSIIHLLLLHLKGSTNPTGLNSNLDKIPFKQFFTSKDFIAIFLVIYLYIYLSFQLSNFFVDPENYILANPLVTPTHIQPEWYFLFAYAILRSIPNKLGGVIALLMSVLVLLMKNLYSGSTKFNFWYSIKVKISMLSFFILTFLGSKVIEDPYLIFSKFYGIIYFWSFLKPLDIMLKIGLFMKKFFHFFMI